jgi:hypothetical protein
MNWLNCLTACGEDCDPLVTESGTAPDAAVFFILRTALNGPPYAAAA